MTTDVVMRRIHDSPAAPTAKRDGHALSDMLVLSYRAKMYSQVEAHWRRNGVALALEGDTGSQVAEEALAESEAEVVVKDKAPSKHTTKSAKA